MGNVFIGENSKSIEIRWISPRELLVVSDAEIMLKMDSFEGISIVIKKP